MIKYIVMSYSIIAASVLYSMQVYTLQTLPTDIQKIIFSKLIEGSSVKKALYYNRSLCVLCKSINELLNQKDYILLLVASLSNYFYTSSKTVAEIMIRYFFVPKEIVHALKSKYPANKDLDTNLYLALCNDTSIEQLSSIIQQGADCNAYIQKSILLSTALERLVTIDNQTPGKDWCDTVDQWRIEKRAYRQAVVKLLLEKGADKEEVVWRYKIIMKALGPSITFSTITKEDYMVAVNASSYLQSLELL